MSREIIKCIEIRDRVRYNKCVCIPILQTRRKVCELLWQA